MPGFSAFFFFDSVYFLPYYASESSSDLDISLILNQNGDLQFFSLILLICKNVYISLFSYILMFLCYRGWSG